MQRSVLLAVEQRRLSQAGGCVAEEWAEYGWAAHVLTPGTAHKTPSAQLCCKACQQTPHCNTWVWCGEEGGCAEHAFQECWLKRANVTEVAQAEAGWSNSPGIRWVSGVVQPAGDPQGLSMQEFAGRVAQKLAHHQQWLRQLRDDASLPLVFLDVSIHGKPAGRIEAVLLSKHAPLAAESLRRLVTGEAGAAPAGHEGAGKPYTLKGAAFYRIIHGFIDQTGAATDSPLGGDFIDEPGALALTHNCSGLLSLANSGPNTNCAHFSLTLAPAHHLDGNYGVFGAVTAGMEVVRAINKLSVGAPGMELLDTQHAVITNCGQLRRGAPFDTKLLLTGLAKKINTSS